MIGVDFQGRYYGSSLGRFTSADDGTDQDSGNPQSWNLYSYVRNNPLAYTDGDGRSVNVCLNDENGNQHCTQMENDQYAAASQGNVGTNAPTLDQVGMNGDGNGNFNATNITDSNGNIIGTATYASDGGADYYANRNGINFLTYQTGPVIDAMGQGLKTMASIVFPFTSLVGNAVVGSDSSQAKLAAMSRKPRKLGQFKGADSLRRENKIARDIIKQLNLQGKQAEEVHDIIQGASIDAGEKLGFTELLEIVKTTLGLL